jgi:hypothetical protein
MSTLAVGALFSVTETIEFTKDGQFVARYLPQFKNYRVTNLNASFIEEQVNAGKALITGYAPRMVPAGKIITG